MTLAFAASGVAFGGSAACAGYFAYKRNLRRHRAWALRSYSQVLAPFLYRYYYFALDLAGYRGIEFYKDGRAGGEHCSAVDETCPVRAFSREPWCSRFDLKPTSSKRQSEQNQ